MVDVTIDDIVKSTLFLKSVTALHGIRFWFIFNIRNCGCKKNNRCEGCKRLMNMGNIKESEL